jgi:NDP-sugar pyrophosphorylase family protein
MSNPDGLAAIVLAGTHHWSGSSFERLAPRPLVPVALAPLVSYSLRWLARGGVRRATICANGTTRALQAALGDGGAFGLALDYYQDGTPRGAAGCVRDAGERAGTGTLVVADGTAIPTVHLTELLAAHDASRAAVTAVIHRERAEAGLPAPSGVYVFDRRVLDHVGPRGFQDIKENLIPRLRRAGMPVMAYESGSFSPHVFDAPTYLAVNHWMLQRLARHDDGTGRVLRDPTAVVEPGARLVGPVQLGPGARVLAGATVVGPATIGPDSTVGRHALVARSVVWSRCVVSEGSVVHGSVLGSQVVLLPGSRLFNVVRPPQPAPVLAPRVSWPARERAMVLPARPALAEVTPIGRVSEVPASSCPMR